jgi:beta-glucanase (GH16 family)
MRRGFMNPMRASGSLAAGLAILILTALRLAAANVLTNPGFELDPAGASVLAWTGYGPNNYNETGPTAHTGSNYFKVYQAFTGVVNSNGIYEDVLSGPGAAYSASAWAYTAASDAIAGQNLAWVEVSFRDVGGNALAVYRSAEASAAAVSSGAFPRNAWALLPVTNQYNPANGVLMGHPAALVAPPNTSFARFQLVFQGDAHNSAGSVYFDDLALNQLDGEAYGDWNVVWSDEFNGTSLNPQVWTYESGGGGWGNNELEYYTSAPANVSVSGGLLHITARRQSMGGYNYTSARIKTQGLYSKLYGRFQWRAKLPGGVGFWPGLWMLGANFSTIGWPGCGEIDVVENNGAVLTNVQGSLHSGSDETAIETLPGGSVTNFHLYTLDWTNGAISWFVDGLRYETQTNWGSSAGSYPFPFNQPFFFIMNLAVGGNYLGNPTQAQINASAFPAELQVDYLRVYDVTAPLQITASGAGAAGQISLSWPSNIVCHLQSAASPDGPWSDHLPTPNPFTASPSAPTFYRLASP